MTVEQLIQSSTIFSKPVIYADVLTSIHAFVWRYID